MLNVFPQELATQALQTSTYFIRHVVSDQHKVALKFNLEDKPYMVNFECFRT